MFKLLNSTSILLDKFNSILFRHIPVEHYYIYFIDPFVLLYLIVHKSEFSDTAYHHSALFTVINTVAMATSGWSFSVWGLKVFPAAPISFKFLFVLMVVETLLMCFFPFVAQNKNLSLIFNTAYVVTTESRETGNPHCTIIPAIYLIHCVGELIVKSTVLAHWPLVIIRAYYFTMFTMTTLRLTSLVQYSLSTINSEIKINGCDSKRVKELIIHWGRAEDFLSKVSRGFGLCLGLVLSSCLVTNISGLTNTIIPILQDSTMSSQRTTDLLLWLYNIIIFLLMCVQSYKIHREVRCV